MYHWYMTQPPQSTKKTDAGHIKGAAAVPSVIEVKMQVLLPNSKSIFHTVHGAYTVIPPNMQTLAGALFTALSSAWGTNLASLMAAGPPATQFTNVFIRDMSNVTNPVYQGTGAAVPGTSASPAMPVNDSIVMTENIAARGRGMKGRVYLGGWATNADGGAGLITGATQTAINNFGTAVFNALNTNNLVPCVAQVARAAYTGVTGTPHNQRGASHVNVTTYSCRDLVWDTQRRRIQP